MKRNLLLATSVAVLAVFSADAQCSFTGLNATYCEGDAAASLVPSGTGGFMGPGITGTTFDPAMAGPGTHTITYFETDPSSYTVNQMGTYAPVAGSGTAVSLGDDQVSAALPIGFSFNFFGTVYTDFYISSNGFITFTNNANSGCCSGAFLPSATTPDNLIAFAWDDMYPPGNGSIEYFTTGTAPYRMCVMNFTDIPFCCDNIPQVTTQVIMYESTNIIELHTTYANQFWSGTQGIQNSGGTIGFPVPGRNSASWTGFTNDYVAFMPSIICSDIQTVVVNPSPTVTGSVSANPICSGDSVIFTGSGADSYTWNNGVTDGVLHQVNSAGTYVVTGTESTNGCSATDTIIMDVTPSPTIWLTPNDEMFGNDGSVNLAIISGTAPFTFDWSNDGTGDNDDSNDLFGVSAGLYTVTMTDATGCSTTASISVGSQVGLEELEGLEFSIEPNPSTGIFNVVLNSNNQNNKIQLLIVNTLGQRILTQEITQGTTEVNMSENPAGIYYVKLVTGKGATVKSIVLK